MTNYSVHFDHEDELWYIYFNREEVCPTCNCKSSKPVRLQRIEGFEDSDDAYEYIDDLIERQKHAEEQYYEENRHAIVQMERYEQFRNEY